MELLIPGLILVALMVYASTRIKRSVARAFESEKFENAEFSIVKPDGFLIPIEDETAGRFNALSREFGKDDYDGVRCVAAAVKVVPSAEREAELERFRRSAQGEVTEEPRDDGIELRGKTENNGHKFDSVLWAITGGDGRERLLRIDAIPEPTDDHSRKIEQMLASFRVTLRNPDST
jgi:hypothetical protein